MRPLRWTQTSSVRIGWAWRRSPAGCEATARHKESRRRRTWLSRSKIAQIATSPKRALDFTVLGAYPPADSQLNQACYDSQPDGLIACTLARGDPMMTEQELNNLIRGKEQ